MRIARRVLCASGTAALALAVCAGGGSAVAQQAGSQSNTMNHHSPESMNPQTSNSNGSMNGGMSGSMHTSMMDKKFLRQSSEGDIFEVKSGKLAAQKGSSQDVKQFGNWMVEQHSQLQSQMKPVAKSCGVTPPTTLKGKERAEYARLKSLSGHSFDQAYIKMMLKDHKTDLAAFHKEADSTQDPTLKQAVEQGAQMIQKHLDKIEQIAQAHNISTGSMG